LRSISEDKPRVWDQDLPQTEFTYNDTIHNSTDISPFSIVYQKVPHYLLYLAKLTIGNKFSSATSAVAEQTIDVQKKVRARLEKSNARYKAVANKKMREKVFKERDMIMIYLRKKIISTGTYNKLKPKKYDPFKIVKKINDNAYIVDLPSDM